MPTENVRILRGIYNKKDEAETSPFIFCYENINLLTLYKLLIHSILIFGSLHYSVKLFLFQIR